MPNIIVDRSVKSSKLTIMEHIIPRNSFAETTNRHALRVNKHHCDTKTARLSLHLDHDTERKQAYDWNCVNYGKQRTIGFIKPGNSINTSNTWLRSIPSTFPGGICITYAATSEYNLGKDNI